MGAATVVTLVGVAIAVAALAVYVIAIGLSLSQLSRKLDKLNRALAGIREQTLPVGNVLTSMLQDATAIEGDLDELLAEVTSLLVAAPARVGPASMQEAVAVARAAPARTEPPPPQATAPASMEEAVARARGAHQEPAAPSRSGGRRRARRPKTDKTEKSAARSGSAPMSEAVAKARQRVGTG